MKEKMTREMAARILHPDTSLEAQEEIGASLDDVNEACRMGAEALRVVREPDPETGLTPSHTTSARRWRWKDDTGRSGKGADRTCG